MLKHILVCPEAGGVSRSSQRMLGKEKKGGTMQLEQGAGFHEVRSHISIALAFSLGLGQHDFTAFWFGANDAVPRS